MTARRSDSPDVTGSRSNQRWVYESIAGALPGIELSRPAALLVQLLAFGTGVVVLAVGYDRWGSLPAGLAAVAVASAGSAFLLTLGRRIRDLDVPESYTQALFGTKIEIVLGLMSFVALVTYLFVIDQRNGGETLLVGVLGDPLPAPGVFLTLLVLWDVCYRIGTGWWASLIGLWRSLSLAEAIDTGTRRELQHLDVVTIGFAWTQLALVPFVRGHPLLVVALVGHVVAVSAVSSASIIVLRRAT
nr:hypothetical protein [Halorhabdus amylolytica]